MRLEPKPKEIVGSVFLAHVEYGVVEVPCVRMGVASCTADRHSAVTGYTTTLRAGVKSSEGSATGYFRTREAAEGALRTLLVERAEWAKVQAESAVRHAELTSARAAPVLEEGVRFSVHGGPGAVSTLYPPGPTATTDEGAADRARDAALDAKAEGAGQ
jgi:hypothetical protein